MTIRLRHDKSGYGVTRENFPNRPPLSSPFSSAEMSGKSVEKGLEIEKTPLKDPD